MFRASILLFIAGLLALTLGMFHIAGLSFEVGRGLFFSFLALAIAGFVAASLRAGKRGLRRHP
jgi:hypothetical protein